MNVQVARRLSYSLSRVEYFQIKNGFVIAASEHFFPDENADICKEIEQQIHEAEPIKRRSYIIGKSQGEVLIGHTHIALLQICNETNVSVTSVRNIINNYTCCIVNDSDS